MEQGRPEREATLCDATESKGPEYMGGGGIWGRERIRPEGIFWGDEVSILDFDSGSSCATIKQNK